MSRYEIEAISATVSIDELTTEAVTLVSVIENAITDVDKLLIAKQDGNLTVENARQYLSNIATENDILDYESELTIEKPLFPIGSIGQLTLFGTEFDDLVYPKLNFEHTECGWFNLKVLNSFPYKIDEKIVRLILNYKNIV